MPIYKNTSDRNVTVLQDISAFGPKVLEPEDTITCEFILDHVQELTRISDLPLYNPLVRIQSVTFSGNNDIQSVNINYQTTKQIVIGDITTDSLEVYLSSMENTPPFVVTPGDILSFECRKKVDKIYMKPSSAGGCKVTEFKEKQL